MILYEWRACHVYALCQTCLAEKVLLFFDGDEVRDVIRGGRGGSYKEIVRIDSSALHTKLRRLIGNIVPKKVMGRYVGYIRLGPRDPTTRNCSDWLSTRCTVGNLSNT